MGSLGLFPFMYRGDTKTFNIWSLGVYSIASNLPVEEGPIGEVLHGSLLVFDLGYHKFQLFKSVDGSNLCIRTKGGSEVRNWIKFTGAKMI